MPAVRGSSPGGPIVENPSVYSRRFVGAAAACLFAVAAAAAQDRGHGRVSLNGSITETPCAIDTRSRDQSVNMGATPTAIIARDGQGATRRFSIRLINCSLTRQGGALPDWRYFRATFDGHDERGLFALTGDARGVALQLADAQGNIARPGVPLPPGQLTAGDQQLDYTLRLVADREVLKAGNLRATLKFRMDYY